MGRSRDRHHPSLILVACAVWLAASCAPPVSVGQRGQEPSPARAPTTLQLGSSSEKTGGILYQGYVQPDTNLVFHTSLTLYDERGDLVPRLAQKVPTVADGDWKVNPDGTMEVTWRFRPDVRWHDGTVVSVDDFLLGFRVRMDKEIPTAKPAWASLVSDIQRRDDGAFTVQWKEPYFLANQAGPTDFVPLPQHVLGSRYADATAKDAFINDLFWTREFVGLGPYKMGEWVLGSHTEGLAFDDYFLGRPKIDRIIFRYYADLGVMTSALLAGAVDMIPIGSIHVEEGSAIAESWAPTGGGRVLVANLGLATLFPQFRDANAPWVHDIRVRHAMAHVLDTQALSDVFGQGLTRVAYTLPAPDDPLYALVEQRGLAKYPHDPRRADQLLAESGWSRGGDGKVRNAGGQILTIEARTLVVTPGSFQRVLAVSDQFNAAGFESPSTPIRYPATDPAARAKTEGVFVYALPDTPTAMNTFISSQLQTESNGWRGSNVWGYSNPIYDNLYRQYTLTLDSRSRQGLLADMLKMAADELMFIPLFYDPSNAVMAVRKGIRGPGPVNASRQPEVSWNIQTWEMD